MIQKICSLFRLLSVSLLLANVFFILHLQTYVLFFCLIASPFLAWLLLKGYDKLLNLITKLRFTDVVVVMLFTMAYFMLVPPGAVLFGVGSFMVLLSLHVILLNNA